MTVHKVPNMGYCDVRRTPLAARVSLRAAGVDHANARLQLNFHSQCPLVDARVLHRHARDLLCCFQLENHLSYQA